MKVVTIGNSPQCDVVLNTDGIEPIHCQVIEEYTDPKSTRWDSGVYYYRLAAFGNNIRVNGQIVKGEVSLDINDNLSVDKFGDCIFWQQWFFPICQISKYCFYFPESAAYPSDTHCNNCIKNGYSHFHFVKGHSNPHCEVCGIKGDHFKKLCIYCLIHDRNLWMPEDFALDAHMEAINERIKQYEAATGDISYSRCNVCGYRVEMTPDYDPHCDYCIKHNFNCFEPPRECPNGWGFSYCVECSIYPTCPAGRIEK